MNRDQVLLLGRSAKVRVLPSASAVQGASASKDPADSLSRLRLTVQTLHALGALPRGRYAASNLAAMLDSMACSPVQALAARVQLLRARMLVEITDAGVVCHDIDRPEVSASVYFEWLVRDRTEVIERALVGSAEDLIEVFDLCEDRYFSAPRSQMDWYRAAFAMGLETELPRSA